MSPSIIPQLVRKDFMLTRAMLGVFCLVSLACIGITIVLFGRLNTLAFINLAFLLLVSPAVTCGMVLLMQTIVFEKERSTQAFIMSLPVTVKQFTQAKLLLNVPVFGAFWLVISGISFYLAFGRGLLPAGTVPFIVMVFVGVFVAYIGILSVSLWRQSLGVTVLSIALFEMGTSGYLWVIAYLDPIARFMRGPEAVWNGTATGIVAAQVLAAVGVLSITVLAQNRKRQFV